MTMLRVLIFFLAATLAGLIVWAMLAGDFAAAGQWLTSDPWGIVTLADLYFGFVLATVVIVSFERRWTAVFWVAPIPFLGNIWTAIWFLARFPAILERGRRSGESG